jgi:hypothetical protein
MSLYTGVFPENVDRPFECPQFEGFLLSTAGNLRQLAQPTQRVADV